MKMFSTWLRSFRSRKAAVNLPQELNNAAVAVDRSLHLEETALHQANEALASGSIGAAGGFLEPYAKTTNRLEILVTLARIRLIQGEIEVACSLLLHAEELYPMEPVIWKTLAESYAIRRQSAEELAYRKKLIYLVRDPHAVDYVAWIRSFISAAKEKSPASIQELTLAVEKVSTARETTTKLQLEFFEALYAVKKLSARALSTYQSISPADRNERDLIASKSAPHDWFEKVDAVVHKGVVPGCGDKEVWLAELKDVIVIPGFQWIPIVDSGAVVLDGFAMHRMKTQSEAATSPQLMHNAQSVALRLKRSMPTISDRAILVGGMPQYYHNTIDFLSALAIVDTLEWGRGLPLVVNDDMAPFQIEQLELLGYSEKDLIKVGFDEQVVFRELIVPSRLVRGGQWMHPLIPNWYRSRFASRVSADSTGPKKLYLSRHQTLRRRITNEEELVPTLEALGYVTVYPERLSVQEQIDLFSGATHLIAPSGAALTNMVYMAPGAEIFGLVSSYVRAGARETYFEPLANACGHNFRWTEGKAAGLTGERAIDADVYVDVEQIVAQLSEQISFSPDYKASC